MPAWSEFLHDASIVLTMAWILLVETGRERFWPLALVIGLAVSVTPAVADPVQVVLAVATIGLILVVSRRRPRLPMAIGILAAGAVIGTLSRTDGPLCDPDSILQGHGLWHVAAAAALSLWRISLKRLEA